MSMEWALINSISPVIYTHDTTPFLTEQNLSSLEFLNIFSFFKNWRTLYKKKEIITYQERE